VQLLLAFLITEVEVLLAFLITEVSAVTIGIPNH